MSVAREITALVKELVRAYKRRGDRGVQAVMDAYVPVAKHKSPPPDKSQEKTGKVSGHTPSRRTFCKRQREARRKAAAWIEEKRRYVGAMGASAAAVAHVESVTRSNIESDVEAISEHTRAEGTTRAEPYAAKEEEQKSNVVTPATRDEAVKASQQRPEAAMYDGHKDNNDGSLGVKFGCLLLSVSYHQPRSLHLVLSKRLGLWLVLTWILLLLQHSCWHVGCQPRFYQSCQHY